MNLSSYVPTLRDTFTGRSRELSILHNWLRDKNPLPVFVIGPRGIGKTALCMAYSEIYRDSYSDFIHLSCSSIYEHSNLIEIVLMQLAHHYSRSLPQRLSSKLDTRDFIAWLKSRKIKKPFLLLIDDIELLSKDKINGFRRDIGGLRDQFRSIFSGSSLEQFRFFDFNKIRSRILQLQNLSQEETWQFIMKRIAIGGLEKSIAEKAYKKLLERSLNFSELTPRFLISVLNAYYHSEDFDSALTGALSEYFGDVSNFLIASIEDRFHVLPAARIETSEIITPSSHIFIGTPFVIIPNFSRFWKEKLEEFEYFLNDPSVKEAHIQKFFEENPRFLKGIEYNQVLAQPVLERDEDGDLIPDFFLKPLTSDFVDILDLKLPKEKLFVGSKNRKRLSGSVTEAMAQLREYRNYFDLPEYRERVRGKYGVTGYKPNTIVVIGRTPPDISEEKAREVLSETPGHISILTYDDLHARMKAMVNNNLS